MLFVVGCQIWFIFAILLRESFLHSHSASNGFFAPEKALIASAFCVPVLFATQINLTLTCAN